MRSTIIIYKRGDGYVADVTGQHGGGARGQRAGLTEYEAAVTAARLMLQYAAQNPEGGDLMAPEEVLKQVPAHLHAISAAA